MFHQNYNVCSGKYLELRWTSIS